MKYSFLFSLIVISSITYSQKNLIQFVNPLIGTKNAGHTFPGATVPFGAVQLSPDTDTIPLFFNGTYTGDVYRYCAGYQYIDSTIVGFSHTHFSGTGHSDLGDILLMPANGAIQLNPGTNAHPELGYRSVYKHENEIAVPNYYRVQLEESDILVELTTTERVGMHKYTFKSDENPHVILDLVHGIYNYEDKNVWTFLRVENDTLITGYRQTNGWGRTRTVYFAIVCDKSIRNYSLLNMDKLVYKGFWRNFDQTNNFPEQAGSRVKAHFDFDLKAGESVQFKVGLSPVSTAGALENIQEEIPHWNFNKVKLEGQEKWEKQLEIIEVNTLTKDDKISFYTSLYHCFLGPTIYMDHDGKYKGLDQNIHTAKGFVNYTTFSLWDTYRALHPLLNIIQQQRSSDMINSMLAHFDQSVHHMLPVWSHYANENWCMIGYHSVPVLADAMIKGIKGFDYAHALQAAETTANRDFFEGLGAYKKVGFVPEDISGSSVSKTLEYAYDDYCVAKMAFYLHNDKLAKQFESRSMNFNNVFDQKTGFMRPKLSSGEFKSPFDPLDTHGQGFIEGNAWNYSLYVPHQPKKMIALMGGDKKFIGHLDSLFEMELPAKYYEKTEDIMKEGIIGNYVHGNEPSHHVSFLYNYTSEPWKTQEKTRMILPNQYKAKVDGLSGNDDCGQMSAWYVFTALGFYPVCPGSNEYALTSPLVIDAVVHLENGASFSIKTKNQSDKNRYIQKISLNGIPLKTPFLSYTDISSGGELYIELGPKPNKNCFKLIDNHK